MSHHTISIQSIKACIVLVVITCMSLKEQNALQYDNKCNTHKFTPIRTKTDIMTPYCMSSMYICIVTIY